MRKRMLGLMVLSLGLMTLLTGCKKELSKEEVEASEYYQTLQKENKDLKNDIEDMEEEINDLSKEILKMYEENSNRQDGDSGNKKAEKYFEKVKNSSLIQVEIAYTDRFCEPVYIRNDAICDFAKKIVENADLTANYTPEKLRAEMGAGYIYTLYEEDDTIFQAEVYGDGYAIFTDLPGQVYYCKGSTALGKALLLRKGSYPNSNLLHRMADSLLVVQDEKKAWDADKCLEAANCIDAMEKTKVNSNRESDKKVTYVFYSYGNKMTLELYKSHICIIAWDGEENWYQASKENIKELKVLFS